MDFGECVEEVFLYPSPAYPLRQGVSVVRGRTKPLSVLKFHVRDGQGNVRLIHDYQKGEEEISFYKKERSPGGLWYIQKKGEEEGRAWRMRKENSICCSPTLAGKRVCCITPVKARERWQKGKRRF